MPNASGVATLTHEQAVGLVELGHEVHILTSTVGQVSAEQDSEVYITRVASPSSSIARIHFLKRELFRECRLWKPNFIWCTTYRGFGVPTMQMAQRLGIPYGIYFHGTELLTENRFLRRSILRCVADRAQVIATNSRNSQKLLSEYYELRAEVITPGVHEAPSVDPEARATIRRNWLNELQVKIAESDAFVFICACRITRQKGIDMAIEAISKLPESLRARCIYVIIGEGPDRGSIRQLSEIMGMEKHIYFGGTIANHKLPTYLAAADCYLQPSQPIGDFLESFGISFLEAHAAGLPCIATRFGGIPEAIKDGETGILVKPGSVSELEEAMTRILRMKEWRGTAGCAAKEWAKANLWTEHICKLDALISA